MKIVILDADTVTTGDISLKPFEQLGEVSIYGSTDSDKVTQRIGDAEAVLCNKVLITKEVMDSCPHIKYIGLLATGYNNIDIEYASKKGIVVTNVPAYSTSSVAQQVFAFILAQFNKVNEYNYTVQNGDWVRSKLFTYFYMPTDEIAGMTLGIVGFGSIGKKVAQIALAFGMKVIVNTRTVPQGYDDIEFVSLDEVLKRSDILTLHCPLTKETENLICTKNLKKMKKTALLINTSRGPVVNEEELAHALNSNTIAKACLDVISSEPMRKDNPLLRAKNCVITPHIAWAPLKTRQRLISCATQNFTAFEKGNPVNIVNKGRV